MTRTHATTPVTRLVIARLCDGKKYDLREVREPAHLTLDLTKVSCPKCQKKIAAKIDPVFESAQELLDRVIPGIYNTAGDLVISDAQLEAEGANEYAFDIYTTD